MATTLTGSEFRNRYFHFDEEPLVYFALEGNDDVSGHSGDDVLYGGPDDDWLRGWSGADELYGGEGNDVVNYTTVDEQVGVTLNFDTGAGSGGDAEGDVLDSIERVQASPYDDVIIGSDVLISVGGNGGDDEISVTGTGQAVYGGDGDDHLDASGAEGASLYGGNDDDTLIGSDRKDGLFGGDGNDVIDAGGGEAESLYGGDGDDLMFGTSMDDLFYGGLGADTYRGGDGIDTVWVGADDASEGMTVDMNGGASSGGDAEGDVFDAIENVFGMTFHDDTVYGNGLDNSLNGGVSGRDRLEGRGGNDHLKASLDGGEFYGGEGDDRIEGSQEADTVWGGADDDAISTYRGDDTIWAGAGEDTIQAGYSVFVLSDLGPEKQLIDAGSDDDEVTVLGGMMELNAGGGDDQVHFDGGYLDFNGTTLDGGEGFDALTFRFDGFAVDLAAETVSWTTGGETYVMVVRNFESVEGAGPTAWKGGPGDDALTLTEGVTYEADGGGGQDVADLGDAAGAARIDLRQREIEGGGFDGTTLARIEEIVAGAGAQTVTGRNVGEFVDLGEGDDTAILNGGKDLFMGGPGADVYDGGKDLDVVIYAESDGGVTVSLARGRGARADAAGDRLSGIENALGSLHDDKLTGDGESNLLLGLDGDDTIWGGGGERDVLFGDGRFEKDGLGSRLFRNDGDGEGDDVIYGGAGFDRILGGAGADTLRGDGFTDHVFGGLGEDRVIGGAGDDLLEGGGGVDELFGGAGRDKLRGGDEADTLSGGGKADTLDGNGGNDLMRGGGGDDTFRGAAGDDRIFGGAGEDRIEGALDDDKLFGGSRDDLLIGGRGDDTLDGGSGGDRLWGGENQDAVDYSGGKQGVAVRLKAKGGAASGGEAEGDSIFAVEDVIGSQGADRIVGDDAKNTLRGEGGADRLNGLEGDDSLVGGAGDDTLVGLQGDDGLRGDAGRDVFVYRPDSQVDRIVDFAPSQDVVRLLGFAQAPDIAALARDGPDGLEVAFDARSRLIFEGFTLATLDLTDPVAIDAVFD